MTREELKRLWFSLDHSKTPERKQIIVNINKGPHWVGYGNIQILSEGPTGYSSFKTFQESPLEYVKTRKEYWRDGYEVIVNGKKVDKI